MVRPRTERKPTLNVSISPALYYRLKKELGDRKVSSFVEKAIVSEFGKKDQKAQQEQKKFERKLAADYQKSDQTPNKEDKMLEEAGVEDLTNEE